MVCLRRTGLYFFNSNRSGVLRRFFVVTYREEPGFSVQSNITCTRFPFAIILYLFYKRSFFSGFFQYGVNAFFINCAKRLGRNFQCYPFVFFGDVKLLLLQVLLELMLRLVIRLRGAIAIQRSFSGDVIFTCHASIKTRYYRFLDRLEK